MLHLNIINDDRLLSPSCVAAFFLLICYSSKLNGKEQRMLCAARTIYSTNYNGLLPFEMRCAICS